MRGLVSCIQLMRTNSFQKSSGTLCQVHIVNRVRQVLSVLAIKINSNNLELSKSFSPKTISLKSHTFCRKGRLAQVAERFVIVEKVDSSNLSSP